MSIILHVEDESAVRLLYKEVFEEQGHEMLQAATAEEALKTLLSSAPDLIILDLKMPGMGGRRFLEKFRRLKLRIPIVISSAYQYSDIGPTAAMADAFVLKSGDLEELVTKVNGLLAKPPRA
jgi:two-component system response regulator (stage 0 sporulation protein F)